MIIKNSLYLSEYNGSNGFDIETKKVKALGYLMDQVGSYVNHRNYYFSFNKEGKEDTLANLNFHCDTFDNGRFKEVSENIERMNIIPKIDQFSYTMITIMWEILNADEDKVEYLSHVYFPIEHYMLSNPDFFTPPLIDVMVNTSLILGNKLNEEYLELSKLQRDGIEKDTHYLHKEFGFIDVEKHDKFLEILSDKIEESLVGKLGLTERPIFDDLDIPSLEIYNPKEIKGFSLNDILRNPKVLEKANGLGTFTLSFGESKKFLIKYGYQNKEVYDTHIKPIFIIITDSKNNKVVLSEILDLDIIFNS